MRVLFTACPGASHLFPVVALARAMMRAGDTVVLATGGGFADRAAETGVPVVAVGGDIDLLSVRPLATPTVADRSGWGRMVALAEHSADDVLALAHDLRPELVVRTPTEFTGALAASVLDVPVIEHSFGLPLARSRMHDADREVAELFARFGARPRLARPSALLDLCPPGFGPARYSGDGPVPMSLRPEPFGGEQVGDPVPDLDVCLTLGTILPRLGLLDTVAPVVDACADLGLRVGVLGVPSASVPARPGVSVWPWLPLGAVLARCRVLVHHGGAGSMLAALTTGVPQLVLPHLTDQPGNAAAVAASGAGRVLDPAELSRSDARTALTALLADGPERAAATVVAADVAALPSADVVAAALHRLG